MTKHYYTLKNFGCLEDCECCPFDEVCPDCGKYGQPGAGECDGDCNNCPTGCAEDWTKPKPYNKKEEKDEI